MLPAVNPVTVAAAPIAASALACGTYLAAIFPAVSPVVAALVLVQWSRVAVWTHSLWPRFRDLCFAQIEQAPVSCRAELAGAF